MTAPTPSTFDEMVLRYLTARIISDSFDDNDNRRVADGSFLLDAANDAAGDIFFDLIGTPAESLTDVLLKTELMDQRGGDSDVWKREFFPAIVKDLKRLHAEAFVTAAGAVS